jgi:hypothetical protein
MEGFQNYELSPNTVLDFEIPELGCDAVKGIN